MDADQYGLKIPNLDVLAAELPKGSPATELLSAFRAESLADARKGLRELTAAWAADSKGRIAAGSGSDTDVVGDGTDR
jgi:hypothetical protein